VPHVLVTGATGFIGRHVVDELDRRGWEIHAAAIDAIEAGHTRIRWHAVDLLEPGAAARLVAAVRPSHLLHLAWYAEPVRYWISRENLRWVRASIDLLDAFIDAGGCRIVGAGSCAEYDWRAGHCVEGQTPTSPATLYGACKLAMGLMVEAAARQAGISAAWARLFFLFGPHEPPGRLVSSVVSALVGERPAECSDGLQVRDFLYVEDVAGALVSLLESDVTGPVNIASGKPTAVGDLVLAIGDQMGRRDLIRLGARPPDPVPVLTAAVDRLTREVGWTPRFSLERALAETIHWWRTPGADARR
jgi:nucleoside-diphosphate-sugar epimerase